MMEQAAALLERLLLGNSFTTVSVSDWWSLHFEGHVLLAQDLVAPEQAEVETLLRSATVPLLDGVDPENISKCVSVLRNVRRSVIGVSLDASGQLRLEFEGGGTLVATCTTPVVDWQWSVNRTGSTPYEELGIACFGVGDVRFADDLAAP